ncbi:pyridoxamine 5'-phosphate oxidase family protein [Lentzea sp. JNUCC 0626]|uniref:pyridoxamine 5'-phosphate oxidase family protein n=1 Tax=Lentzea sp. JNUCC 0626 TaxID=3367513 RepID=UPI003747F80D
MSDEDSPLNSDDREFLGRPLYGILTTAEGPVPAQPRPVWFEVGEDGTVHLFTAPDAVKVRRLRSDPRASLVVIAPVGERERWLSITGRVTLGEDGASDLVARLFARYWGAEAPSRADELAGMLALEWVRIDLHPEKVRRFVN